MVKRCVAAGCSNAHSECVSLFKFPTDSILRRKLEKQVQRTRARWKAAEHSILCRDHFNEDCLDVHRALAFQFGMNKRRRLKPEAVPTIFHRLSTSQVCTSNTEERSLCKRVADVCPVDNERCSKRKRGAVVKRERLEV